MKPINFVFATFVIAQQLSSAIEVNAVGISSFGIIHPNISQLVAHSKSEQEF